MTENANEADQEDSSRAVDLYDLAAAAGQSGEAFEERASQWRARGEIAGGRRDVARRILEVSMLDRMDQRKTDQPGPTRPDDEQHACV